MQSGRNRPRLRQHGDVHRPRVHLCNAGLNHVAQDIKPRCQRATGRPHVHICNRTSKAPRIPSSLHRAIAIAIGRMRLAVVPPVARMSGPPVGLSADLILAIVGIDSKALVLPCAPASTLARLG
ncbi:hypothetical protein Bcenmc03_0029 [Burkholderia orbicola MC0-3]|uniref:Uncharacterized protein n=1 Tax=Burkholderia orbicola (strain MC0-3) TaxID=406425 RepID=B1K1C1_BURO0|nr:hypothetical protein Bcenmc03_0029 [Burkholderia orbicola MC0-3]